MSPARVVSGMRPTGGLHLGHYHGVLANWLRLQEANECFFFVADWHALTTHYGEGVAQNSVREMTACWLAAGVDPERAVIFRQSAVAAHAELHTLLGMICPLPWLERIPSYKELRAQLCERDLATYGFLGYPLLQSADILIYRADFVPVGKDQVSHIEFCREIARRFNNFYGWDVNPEAVLAKLSGYRESYEPKRKEFQQSGNMDAKEICESVIRAMFKTGRIDESDVDFLRAHIEGRPNEILHPPQEMLTPEAVFPGLDGRKMSKSYGNTIELLEDEKSTAEKIRTMPTDPARIKRSDKGDPGKCPVWPLHQIYSDEETRAWADDGCRTASIGCIECKRKLSDAINEKFAPLRLRGAEYMNHPSRIDEVLAEGGRRARAAAEPTMEKVRAKMGVA
jgi:tryptophanyl-tRNA synthetase